MKDELLELLNDPLFQPNSEEQALFELTPAMAEKTKEKMQADFVAQRRPCENFEQYEPLFKQVHEDLRTGRRRLAKFAYSSLKAGNASTRVSSSPQRKHSASGDFRLTRWTLVSWSRFRHPQSSSMSSSKQVSSSAPLEPTT